VNVGAARSAGVEFTSEADILPNLVGSINYTYTETRISRPGGGYPASPAPVEHRAHLGAHPAVVALDSGPRGHPAMGDFRRGLQ